jgi:hypothetical protein
MNVIFSLFLNQFNRGNYLKCMTVKFFTLNRIIEHDVYDTYIDLANVSVAFRFIIENSGVKERWSY